MDPMKEAIGITLFPHIYAIPLTIIAGMALGYYLRGRVTDKDQKLPPRPKVD